MQALKPGGVAIVAAKSYYFGVGGSTEAFKKLAALSSKLVLEDTVLIDDGASNKREILTFRRQL